jgi:hypothetical protein
MKRLCERVARQDVCVNFCFNLKKIQNMCNLHYLKSREPMMHTVVLQELQKIA